MTVLEGAGVAVIAAAVTLLAVSLAGLALVAVQIQEERRGSGCRGAGCRRSQPGHGCTNGPRVAETARGHITGRE